MGNGTRKVYTCRLDEGFSLECSLDYPDQLVPDEGRQAQWSKSLYV